MSISELSALTPEQKNARIAEACGWTDVRWIQHGREAVLIGTDPEQMWDRSVPDYCRDLNACQAAWETLSDEQKHQFQRNLSAVLYRDASPSSWNICATAAQRTDALLLTL